MVYGFQYNEDHLAKKSKISREKEEGILYEIYFRRFGADNYAVFNEDEKLVRVECHPMDKHLARLHVEKNLAEFLKEVREMKIPKGRTLEPFEDYTPDEFD